MPGGLGTRFSYDWRDEDPGHRLTALGYPKTPNIETHSSLLQQIGAVESNDPGLNAGIPMYCARILRPPTDRAPLGEWKEEPYVKSSSIGVVPPNGAAGIFYLFSGCCAVAVALPIDVGAGQSRVVKAGAAGSQQSGRGSSSSPECGRERERSSSAEDDFEKEQLVKEGGGAEGVLPEDSAGRAVPRCFPRGVFHAGEAKGWQGRKFL